MPVLPVKRTYLLHSAFTKLIKHFGKKLLFQDLKMLNYRIEPENS